MSTHIMPLRGYMGVFALLMVLLVVTVAAAFVDFGSYATAVALGIAATKAVFIVLYFMDVKQSPRTIWVCALAGFFWLAILLTLTLSDYLSRGWLPAPSAW